MQSPGRSFGLRRWRIAASAMLLVCGGLLLAVLPAAAQEAAPADTEQAVTPPPEPSPSPSSSSRPGALDAVGNWFVREGHRFRDHLQGAKRKWDELGDDAAANDRAIKSKASEASRNAAAIGKDAADATKSAVEAVGGMAAGRVMTGRERCMTAPNGAPDCLAAADALCRKHGFSTGKSIDFTSAEECPPKLVQGVRAACVDVTFISQAMCQ